LSHFTPRETVLREECWVGPRAGLDVVKKEKNLLLLLGFKPVLMQPIA
jgi:hypothetical protein